MLLCCPRESTLKNQSIKSYRLKNAVLSHLNYYAVMVFLFLSQYLHMKMASYGRAVQRGKSSEKMELSLRSLTCGVRWRRKRKSRCFQGVQFIVFVQF